MGESFDVKSFSPWRKCKRCGIVQRGTYDKKRKDITWETMRERDYSPSRHGRIVRQPSSGLDQLAHTLRLRRSRLGDRTAQVKRPARSKP
jgi:hypothetical protein